MKIRIERLEIEVPGFMDSVGEIVLGNAQADRLADGEYSQRILGIAQAVFNALTSYLKFDGSDDEGELITPPPSRPRPVEPTEEHPDPDPEL